ncbi:protein mono-ADP-ribosyltransferase PARP9 isoform X3 [Pipistrellus kuhlii]|uniref:protein mono-ADP-ribosyltransferase PARP9 isoform X3 n=1 Tax=Pipistrellus kuhlii TaxID=59472 RepID=UPI00174F1DB7|nr:protein mono-ADP-ribosyltransferase PARP9 isoform X3 [Pipistrellus kuhlii]
MEFSKDAGAAAYNEKSGRISLTDWLPKAFTHICAQWRKGSAEGDCLPCKCSETDILGENCSWQIPINHNDFKFLQNNESLLCEVLRNKFGCVSTLVSPARESNSVPHQVFRKRLTAGLELSVWKDDLTRHAIDVVVNAANEELRHGGGLAQALVKAGGQQIQEESDMFISKYGKIPTGEVAITGPGKLPCKFIIHAVGPRWEERDAVRCKADLQKAIRSILNCFTSDYSSPETVAIPALSSGIFRFPLDLCTRIIVETIKLYFQTRPPASNLREIHLVSNEDPTVASFKTASEYILGSNELGSSVSQGAILPFNTMVVNRVTLQIVQGHIELQQTDVIVNSVFNWKFESGPVSRSILQQAGQEIEVEFLKKKQQTSQNSQLVLVTKGFKLACQYVFHVLWFSTYYSDQAFSTAMEKVKSKHQLPNNYSVPQEIRGNPEKELKAKSPAVNLMGLNREKICEAQEWIQRMLTLQDKHIIENNHILFLGKKEHDILSQLQERVSISEIISPGKATLEIQGAQADLIKVVMNIELMLCEVQEEIAKKKERALCSLSGQWTDQQPIHQDEMKENKFLKCLKLSTPEIQDQKKKFENCGFWVIKVEKIDNVLLMAAFQRKKKMMEERMPGKPVSHRLFQQVPQQFCEVACRVGFQRMYSMPCDPKYGAGIYFTKNLRNLLYQAKKTSASDKLTYVFEAEVLTGSFSLGDQTNIVPPPLIPGGTDRHDSVVDSVSSPETFVIFNSVQAMPQYLWTCIQEPVWSQDYLSKPMKSYPQLTWREHSSGSPVD